MRKPHKLALIGILTLGTVSAAHMLFASFGLMFGTEQVLLTSAAGALSSARLFAGA